MASEYKKRDGRYTTDEKDQDESQKHLSGWIEKEWQIKNGSAHARQDDGSRKHYLPKKAWENMTDEERKETDEKKLAESKGGKQHVQDTNKARASRLKANKEEHGKHEKKTAAAKDKQQGQNDDRGSASEEEQDEEEQDEIDNTGGTEDSGKEEEQSDGGRSGPKNYTQAGKKRGRPRGNSSISSEKQKSNSGEAQKGATGSKKQPAEPPADDYVSSAFVTVQTQS